MLADETELVENAYACLRDNTRADLRFEEHLRPIRYVIAPGNHGSARPAPSMSGRLVAPVMVAMLDAVDTVLFIPECAEGAMEVQVTLEEFREVGGTSEAARLADRWRIYHGEPDDVRWATMLIDMARFEGHVIDGEALMRANPLGGEAECAICRHMNAEHTDDLRRMCRRYADIEIESPVMVGIDPLGIDVRARFDVVRVPATEPMNTREEARRVLAAMSQAGK